MILFYAVAAVVFGFLFAMSFELVYKLIAPHFESAYELLAKRLANVNLR